MVKHKEGPGSPTYSLPKGPRTRIYSLPPQNKGGIGGHSREFSKEGFGPYPQKTGLRIVSAFDAKDLGKYLCRDEKKAQHANGAFLEFLGKVEKEAKAGTERACALIEIGDMILESETTLGPKWALCEVLIKNLFQIEDADLGCVAAFLMRAHLGLMDPGSSISAINLMLTDPEKEFGGTESLGRILKYVLDSLGMGGERGEFAKRWCRLVGEEGLKEQLEALGYPTAKREVDA